MLPKSRLRFVPTTGAPNGAVTPGYYSYCKNKTDTTKCRQNFWIGCNALCVLRTRSQTKSCTKKQKSWSLDPATTSSLVPSGKSVSSVAKGGHACPPGGLGSLRARVLFLGSFLSVVVAVRPVPPCPLASGLWPPLSRSHPLCC